jgi:DNA mismatch endonuclease, patch repair protein
MSSYPEPTNVAATSVMRGNRKRDTRPEVRVRSQLHKAGYRFRKNLLIAMGEGRVRPDIVFTRYRLAVFIDGCFWHRCPDHGTSPRSNSWYWGPKLDRNVERDRMVDGLLQNSGWMILRVWEHEPPELAATRIVRALSSCGLAERKQSVSERQPVPGRAGSSGRSRGVEDPEEQEVAQRDQARQREPEVKADEAEGGEGG